MPSPALGVFSTLLQPGCLPQFLQDLTCALASALPLPRKRRPPPANHRVHPLLPTASGARVWRCSVRVGPWSHHTEEARGPSLGWQVINPPPPRRLRSCGIQSYPNSGTAPSRHLSGFCGHPKEPNPVSLPSWTGQGRCRLLGPSRC